MDHEAIAQLLGNYGEFVGSIGVIITLGYLAIQVRQNTKLSQTEYFSSSVEQLRPFQFWRAESQEKARIYRVGMMDFDAVTPDEQMMLDGLLHSQIMQFADARSAYARGFLDDATFEGLKIYVASLLGMPGAAHWWKEAKFFYSTTGLDELLDNAIGGTQPYHTLMPSLWVQRGD